MVRLLLEATRAPLDRLWIEERSVAPLGSEPTEEARSEAEEAVDGDEPADPS